MVYVDYSDPINPVVWVSRTRRRVAFGLALERFFREHGITRQEDMARVIREAGYPREKIGQGTISNWLRGESEPVKPSELSEALVEALPTTREQREYLSVALFFPLMYLQQYHPLLVTPEGG